VSEGYPRKRPNSETFSVPLICRIITLDELEYFRNDGILSYVLRQLAP
jgi:aconitate hydratase